MFDIPSNEPGAEKGAQLERCSQCDAVTEIGAEHCRMCGAPLSGTRSASDADSIVGPVAGDLSEPAVFESIMRERRSPVTFWLTAAFTIIILVLGSLVLRFQSPNVTVALVPSRTPFPPTATLTPSLTPLPTETRPATEIPTVMPSPLPSGTPSPPRPHTVTSGDTLVGLAFRFRVSAEAIASENGISPDVPIQLGQTLMIPWPTPTPPLETVMIEIGGEPVIVDPSDCPRIAIEAGDSISVIAARYDVDVALLLLVNRLTEETIIQPGDTICIPEIRYGASLPPTPGPSPTLGPTPFPAGPQLLYPVNEATIEPPESPVRLQWVAVKDLDTAEQYMVELVDVDDLDAVVRRGFTRDNSFLVPPAWRPQVEELRRFRWQVSLVQVTGTRSDGVPIYTYGGETSEPSFFRWLGATSTPTPRPTATTTSGS